MDCLNFLNVCIPLVWTFCFLFEAFLLLFLRCWEGVEYIRREQRNQGNLWLSCGTCSSVSAHSRQWVGAPKICVPWAKTNERFVSLFATIFAVLMVERYATGLPFVDDYPCHGHPFGLPINALQKTCGALDMLGVLDFSLRHVLSPHPHILLFCTQIHLYYSVLDYVSNWIGMVCRKQSWALVLSCL